MDYMGTFQRVISFLMPLGRIPIIWGETNFLDGYKGLTYEAIYILIAWE